MRIQRLCAYFRGRAGSPHVRERKPWGAAARCARATFLVSALAGHLGAQPRVLDPDAGVRGWIASHAVVVEHEPALAGTYTARAASLGPCQAVLTTTDSVLAGTVQIVSEKTVALNYGQLRASAVPVPFGNVWLLRLGALHGQALSIRTRFVIQDERWEREARVAFVELIAPTHPSADTLATLVRSAIVACRPSVQLAAAGEGSMP